MVELAHERGASISIDCQWCPDLIAAPDLADRLVAARPAVFLPNLDEALAITRAAEAADALESLAAWVPTVITMGAAGALAGCDGERYARPALPVNAMDTTGAGDAFDAGFIYGLLHGRPSASACAWRRSAAASRPRRMAARPRPRAGPRCWNGWNAAGNSPAGGKVDDGRRAMNP